MAAPTTIQAGDEVRWTVTDPDRPATAGWRLHAYLAAPGTTPMHVEATPDGADHAFALAGPQTAPLAAGTYTLTLCAVMGSARTTLETSTVRVLPDPSQVSQGSHAARMVPLLEAALEACAGRATVEYELDGVRNRVDRMECVRLLSIFRGQLRRERGGAFFRKVYA